MLFPLSPTVEIPLADWTKTIQRSTLRQMLAVASQPGILSFAGGLPAAEFFPTVEYGQALAHVLATDPRALQYGPPFMPLKKHIVNLMAERGVVCNENQVFLTTGAQQGINILTRMLLNPDSEIILEERVYTGFQQALSPRAPKIHTVSSHLDTGIDVDAVEALLEEGHQPAFMYIMPDAHNPLGVSLSLEKRQRLVELARTYHFPIIEDDAYGFLWYDQPFLPPLRSLDENWVFYLGSFSKILAPALRLGWIIVPEALITKLTVIKEMGDLESSALIQRSVAAYLDSGSFPEHIARLRHEYRLRRDTMLSALDRHFPANADWMEPQGGLFIWVELPRHIDTTDLLHLSLEKTKVAFIPGQAFAVPGTNANHCLRLNFSNCNQELIEDGIGRLAKVINTL